MPRGSEPGKFPELIQQVNASIEKAFADDPKVVVCDTWEIFADEQGAAKKEEFPDLLHPNAAGYAKWEAALQPILEQLKVTKAN
jgi:lysophospholipase L1-like esterase